MKTTLVMSAGSKPVLEAMIKDYFFNPDIAIVTEGDKHFVRKKDGTTLDSVAVVVKGKRWRLERLG